MRKILVIILAAVTLTLSGCVRNQSVAPSEVKERTSAGTVINDDFSTESAEKVSTPDSSAFTEIGYIRSEETLVVTFRNTGYSYAYYGVPVSVWNKFRSADSKGSYYNSDIKGNYKCEKIEW